VAARVEIAASGSRWLGRDMSFHRLRLASETFRFETRFLTENNGSDDVNVCIVPKALTLIIRSTNNVTALME